jgi:hypothetical protein
MPQFVAGEVVAEEAARTEVGDDVLAISGRRRGCGAAFGRVIRFEFLEGGFGAPSFGAVGAVVGDGVELAVVEGGEDQQFADERGRRGAAGRGDFPLHVFVGTDLGRRLLIVRGDAGALRAAELRPGGEFVSAGRSCQN